MRQAILTILAVAFFSVGCLEKEVVHTLYVEPDGTVTWEVLEREVRSTAEDAEDREREEAEYLAAAVSGRPSIVEALEEIGGYDVSSQLLRDRRPFSIVATARFADLGAALDGLIRGAEIDATVDYESDGIRNTLTMTPAEMGGAVDGEDSTLLEELIADEMRFVLAVGKFEESEGFVLENDRVALWPTDTADEKQERLRLVWSVARR